MHNICHWNTTDFIQITHFHPKHISHQFLCHKFFPHTFVINYFSYKENKFSITHGIDVAVDEVVLVRLQEQVVAPEGDDAG